MYIGQGLHPLNEYCRRVIGADDLAMFGKEVKWFISALRLLSDGKADGTH